MVSHCPDGTTSPDWLSRLSTVQILISKSLSPKKQATLTGFFRFQEEHILLTASSTPWPISSQKIRIILPFVSTCSLQPNPSWPPLPHNSFSLCHSFNHTLTALLFQQHSAVPNSVPYRAAAGPFYSMGASGVSSLGLCSQRWLFYFYVFLLAVVWCITHPIQCAMCIIHTPLPRGVNSEMREWLSFVSKCLHSENCRLLIRSVNQVMNIAKTGKDPFQTFLFKEKI